MSEEKEGSIFIVQYDYEKDELDVPEELLSKDPVLTKAINNWPLPEDVEVFEKKQNVLATSNGFYAAQYEKDLELSDD